MDRRTALASAVATIGTVLAGCISSGESEDTGATDSPTPTPTATQTPTAEPTRSETPESTETPTPTETATQEETDEAPEIRRPEVFEIQPVEEWIRPGDFEENAINEPSAGDTFDIAYKYLLNIREGSVKSTDQIQIFNADEDRVYRDVQSEELLIDKEDGPFPFEWAFRIPAGTLEPGEYTVEIIIRDEKVDMTSEAFTDTIEVV